MINKVLFAGFILIALGASSQSFTRQDSLRGTIGEHRSWWDLLHYNLSVAIDTGNQSITGSNVISYKVLANKDVMQIDLQSPLQIIKVEQDGEEIQFTSEGNAHFVQLIKDQPLGSVQKLKVSYQGLPTVARRPPWSGGFSWERDQNGNPFIATSNQGIGASIWWPCKDHPADEPDQGVVMSFTVPENLVAVGNGRLTKVKKGKRTKTYTWEVTNPINAYGVNLNAADYAKFEEIFEGENGPLDMTYYVLSYNLEKAKKHFKEVTRTLEAFEYWFGPYPFYEDGYKLVETPYLGMEHQSSVTYGNGYEMGYRGRDLSLSGWGLKWDYIIIHETAHEWFANNITCQDVADLWIHESFTCYSEGLFTEYHYGKDAGAEYIRGLRHGISNSGPIIGAYGVNKRGEDIYGKGANILHTLRQLIDDDEKWRGILRGLNETFYHQTTNTQEVEKYIAEQSGLDLTKFFDQYLRTSDVPVLEYSVYQGKLMHRWTNCIEGFDMPIPVAIGDKTTILYPQTRWNYNNLKVEVPEGELIMVDPNYYVYSTLITGK
ncbi:MAG: M1 family metallopeptidase [Cyclobacteriaceae bacterium]